jgi:endonuclease YncB( thermonuclease family)
MFEALLVTLSIYIYDGDNLRVQSTTPRQTYRLVGLNAPEIRAACPQERALAIRARDRLRQLTKLPTAHLQEVLCYGSNFGRRCAVITVNGKNVADTLVGEGLAEPYWCGSSGCPKRKDWCRG